MLIKSTTTSTSMVAAAVAALFLAGCGGGSDNGGGTGAESGGLSTKTNGTGTSNAHTGTNHGAASNSETGATDSASTGGTAGATGTSASNNAADGNASQTALTHGAITEAGISTELFEKILTTQTAVRRIGPRAEGISRYYRASPITSPEPGGKWIEDTGRGQLQGYQQPVGTFYQETWGVPKRDANGDEKTDFINSSASFGYEIHKEGDGARDKRLTIKTEAELKSGSGRDAGGKETFREVNALVAGALKTIPRNGVVNFDEPVQEWNGKQDNSKMKLLVQRGSAANEVQLCLQMNSSWKEGVANSRSLVQRLSCSVWRVQPDWTSDKSPIYFGIYVMEDNDGSGRASDNDYYWKTKPMQDELNAADGKKPAADTQSASAQQGTAQSNGEGAVGTGTAGTAAGTEPQRPRPQPEVTSAAPATDAAGSQAGFAQSTTTDAANGSQGTTDQAGSSATDAAKPATDAAGSQADSSQSTATDTTNGSQGTTDQAGNGTTDAGKPAPDVAAGQSTTDATSSQADSAQSTTTDATNGRQGTADQAGNGATDAAKPADTLDDQPASSKPAQSTDAAAPAADAGGTKPDTLDSK